MKWFYQIADIDFTIDIPWNVKENDSFLPFKRKEEAKDSYHIYVNKIDSISFNKEEIIFENNGFAIYKQENNIIKVFHDNMKDKNIYAYVEEEKNKEITIYCISPEYIHDMNGLFFHIGLENVLLKENKFYYHSCCVKTEWGGILFSGMKGSGKSTQGNLWCKYTNSSIINGDKTILCKEENWVGYGSPYAGSSKVYVNDKCTIKAIVMLKKAPVCTIRKLSKAEAFKNIYSQIIINIWNDEFIHKACDFASMLIKDIDVYEFSCTPDQNAVEFLMNELKGCA